MGNLKRMEIRFLKDFFDVKDGYIFKGLVNENKYNKNITRDIIIDACGIDIFTHEDYKNLSQQKCFEKIIESNDSVLISNVLMEFYNYYTNQIPNDTYISTELGEDLDKIDLIIKTLLKDVGLAIPNVDNESMETLIKDIKKSLAMGNPELCLDRLHTFCTKYLRDLCLKHGILIDNDNGEIKALHSIAGELAKFYQSQKNIGSDFVVTAFKSMISLLEKLNGVRNNKSYAHVNEVLEKTESLFVVKSTFNILELINSIETDFNKHQVSKMDIDDLPF